MIYMVIGEDMSTRFVELLDCVCELRGMLCSPLVQLVPESWCVDLYDDVALDGFRGLSVDVYSRSVYRRVAEGEGGVSLEHPAPQQQEEEEEDEIVCVCGLLVRHSCCRTSVSPCSSAVSSSPSPSTVPARVCTLLAQLLPPSY
jgi:hypothetical protein